MPYARMLSASRTDQHHVRNVYRAFLVKNASADILLRIRPRVLLHDVGVFNGDAALLAINGEHFARLALGPAGHHLDHVAMANAENLNLFVCLSFGHRYHTSGASETILVNFFSRSSRATGPKTRVPIGSFASLISTAALSSNRMYVPSLRRCSFRVRTTTAFTTVPFLTCVSGVASFTAAVIMSPRPAVSPASPPTGRMQVNCRAPELSATVSHVRICTIALLPLKPVELCLLE